MRGLKLAAAAAAALVTAACGSGGGDAGSDESDSAKSITVWMMGSGTPEQTKFLDGVEAEFQKEHAGVEVDVQYIPWPDAAKKFQTALAGGEGPDVTEVGNTDTQTWIGQDAFLDLSADLETWDEGKDIVPSLLANDQSDGNTYALPWYVGVRAVYYRTDWFTELGLALPTNWDELVAAAQAIQAAKPGVAGLAVAGNYNYALYPFVWSAGGEIATQSGDTWEAGIDSPEAKEGITFYTDLVKTAKVSPEASIAWDELEPQKQFALEKAGMIIAGNWAITEMVKTKPDLESVTGSFPIPGKDGGVAPAFAGGSDLAIWADTAKKALAWDYLTTLSSKKNQLTWAQQSKFFPAFSDVLEGAEFQDDPLLAGFASQLQETKMVPLSPNWVEVAENKAVLQNMVKNIMTGQATVDDAAAAAADEIESLLNAG